MLRHPVSPKGVLLIVLLDLFNVSKMTNFNYDSFKVSKMTNFNYDLSKVSKMTNYSCDAFFMVKKLLKVAKNRYTGKWVTFFFAWDFIWLS